MISIKAIKVTFILATLTLAAASVFSRPDGDSSTRCGMLYIIYLMFTALLFGDCINQYLVQFKPNSGINIEFIFSTAIPLSVCFSLLLVWPMAANNLITRKHSSMNLAEE